MSQLRVGHLFAGIGGGILSDLILGHKPIFAVEWDKYCCQVLRERVEDGWFEEMQSMHKKAHLRTLAWWKANGYL
jgi:site-specific DNA-cytosine methylase